MRVAERMNHINIIYNSSNNQYVCQFFEIRISILLMLNSREETLTKYIIMKR